MNTTDKSIQNQRNGIDEMKQRVGAVVNVIGGNEITALPNVYAGWLDSELMCEVIEIKKDAEVLDLCTGTGVIAIRAAQLGAKRVVAVDLNPEAVKCAKFNAEKLGLHQIAIREGSLFEPVLGDKFDVIIINPPYIDHEARDKTEICFWDLGNSVTRQFFELYKAYLNPDGRVYLAWGDFADVRLLQSLAKEKRATLKLLGKKVVPGGQETFLAYELLGN
jgi:release factor glutamine methyltransferase